MKATIPAITAFVSVVFGSAAIAANPPNNSRVFQNLQVLSNSYRIDDPSVIGEDPRDVGNVDGPKGLATADLDGDGRSDLVASNTDGTIAVLFGRLGGGFEPAIYLQTGSPKGLRDVHCANINSDPRPEIIAAHPFDGKLYVCSVTGASGSRTFSQMQAIETWPGARSIISGDFNGDSNTDLLVAGSGGANGSVLEFRGDGTGNFTPQVPISAVDAGEFDGASATPVFAMCKWRRAGDPGDRIVVTFPGATHLWFLKSPAAGQPLALYSILPVMATERKIYDIAVGIVTAQARVSGEPDLLTADIGGTVYIRRSTGGQYPTLAQGGFAVPGGPRGMGISDVNTDTWPDLIIGTRNTNAVYIYKNNNGVFSLGSESPTGDSPRDVVAGDFDGNGMPDAAVINRDSQDITVHLIDPATGTFRVSPLLFTNHGGAASASIRDMNNDGRGELLYVNPITGEATVQSFGASGQFLPATRYFMGSRPQSLTTPDINGDGKRDLVSASIGQDRTGGGGIKYRLQTATGTFGPLIEPPPPAPGISSALRTVDGDFNGDGITDCAVLFDDDHIGFYRGTTSGLVQGRVETFVLKCRASTAVDLDHDGDLDIVGVGVLGDLAYIINNGTWFATAGSFLRTVLPRSQSAVESNQIIVDDKNGDGRLDVTVYGETAVSRWNGQAGVTIFEFAGTTQVPKTLSVARSEVGGPRRDFDGDGLADDFALSPNEATLHYFKGTTASNGQWWTLTPESYAVPSSSHLAIGDIDGDGRMDLAGVGEYVWVSLSNLPSPATVPTPVSSPTAEISGVVINEILASTVTYVSFGSTKAVDCVEVLNSTLEDVIMTGWKLRRSTVPGEDTVEDFVFPASSLAAGARKVIFCNAKSGQFEAPFKLPEDGCTLTLLNAAGVEINSVTYGPQQPDVSYSRLVDASRTFVYNPLPSIGGTNYDNGNTDPVISFRTVDMSLLRAGIWRFRGRAWSPNGMLALTIFWREVTSSPTPRSGNIPLYDDGMHDDGASFDGVYAGDWDAPLPAGSAIEFYLSGTDLREKNVSRPGESQFSAPGQQITNYSLSIPAAPSQMEISEVVSQNRGILFDEFGHTPDLAEVRYTGAGTISMEGIFLADSLFGVDESEIYAMASQDGPGTTGNTRLVFLDGTPVGSGGDPRHAPFRADGDGDTIYLFRRLPSGVIELLDWVAVPPLQANVAYARLGAGGEFVQTEATPGVPNAPPGGKVLIVPRGAEGTDCIFLFSGKGKVEASSDLLNWTVVLPEVPDLGIEHVYREQFNGAKRFFRVR